MICNPKKNFKTVKQVTDPVKAEDMRLEYSLRIDSMYNARIRKKRPPDHSRWPESPLNTPPTPPKFSFGTPPKFSFETPPKFSFETPPSTPRGGSKKKSHKKKKTNKKKTNKKKTNKKKTNKKKTNKKKTK
jgi:hypothetical protein